MFDPNEVFDKVIVPRGDIITNQNPSQSGGCVDCGLDLISPGIDKACVLNSPSIDLIMPQDHITNNAFSGSQADLIGMGTSYHLRVLFPRYVKVGACEYDLNEDKIAQQFFFKYTIKSQGPNNQNPSYFEETITMKMEKYGDRRTKKFPTPPEHVIQIFFEIIGPCDKCCSYFDYYREMGSIRKYKAHFYYNTQPGIYLGDSSLIIPDAFLREPGFCEFCGTETVDQDYDPSKIVIRDPH